MKVKQLCLASRALGFTSGGVLPDYNIFWWNWASSRPLRRNTNRLWSSLWHQASNCSLRLVLANVGFLGGYSIPGLGCDFLGVSLCGRLVLFISVGVADTVWSFNHNLFSLRLSIREVLLCIFICLDFPVGVMCPVLCFPCACRVSMVVSESLMERLISCARGCLGPGPCARGCLL